MSIWLAGLLAVLIVVGGLASIVLVFAAAIWIGDAMLRTSQKMLDVSFKVFVAICALGTLAGLWYIALSWLMGWPL